MKKYPLTLLTISLSLVLTACSSSRGGDSVNTSKYLTEKPASNTNSLNSEQNPSSSETNTAKAPQQNNTQSSGTAAVSPQVLNSRLFVAPPANGTLSGAVVTLKTNGTSESRSPINNGKEMLNELIIGDSRVVLFNANDLLNGNGLNGFKTLSNKDAAKETPINETVSGYVGGWGSESSYNPSEFRNMRFGVVNVGSDSHLFVQGYLTPTSGVQVGRNGEHYPMPKEGKVLYEKGYALYGKDGNYQQLTAEVEANFNDKKIDVKLKAGETEKLAFNGVIEGNTFSGKTNGIESKGAFYGSRAAEVGGVFYQTEGADNGKNGVFGAVDKRFIQ